MGYNYQFQKNRFENKWKEKELLYRREGMKEKTISRIRDYDLHVFNRDRAYYKRRVLVGSYDRMMGESGNTVVNMNSGDFYATDEYFLNDINGWFEMIDDEALAAKVRKLKRDDLIIFREYYVYGKTQKAVSEKLGLTRRKVQLRLNRIKEQIQ